MSRKLVLPLCTERLSLGALTHDDAGFILEILNSAGWLQYIGDRKVNTAVRAEKYIAGILKNDKVNYWVVRIKNINTPVGVITIIKKDYLSHHDIGFAFLPDYTRKGYAFEAAKVVLDYVLTDHHLKKLVAVTIPENLASINLLNRLGFKFKEEIEVEDQKLSLYNLCINYVHGMV